MEQVLVAGATGELGRLVVEALVGRGFRVRALARSAERARPLAQVAHEVVIADVTRPASLEGVCRGVDRVFSCVGQTVGLNGPSRPGFYQVDYHGNRRLLDAARRAGVKRFVYTSVFGAEEFPELEYMRAHADLARDLRQSGMGYGVVQPTGFFSALAMLLDMAKSGRAFVFGDGRARSNPIHDADLAEVCADTVARDDNLDLPVGGPVAYTRREMAELAFAALGRRAQISAMPAWTPQLLAGLARPFAPRTGALLAFVGTVFTHDVVAPMYGTRRLDAYFEEQARRRGLVKQTV